MTWLPKCFWLHDECFARWLGKHLMPLGRTVCDVGAGDGFMLNHLHGVFSKVIAVEPSPSGVRLMRNRVRSREVRIIKGTAESIPLPDNIVDIAFAKSSFHHFESMTKGISEMCRVASQAVAIIEVISPSVPALRFAKDLLPQKEQNRSRNAVFSESDLKSRIAKVARAVRCLHFDQYVDVQMWLESGDLSADCQSRLFRHVASQTGKVKRDMQIHFQQNRLVMLRRMALVIGLLA